MKKLLLASVIACCSSAALADDLRVGGVGAKLSTLGVGVEYTLPVHEKVDLGLGLNYFQYSREFKKEDITADTKLRLLTVGPTAYFYPWDNGFNFNGGVFYNGNRLSGDVNTKSISAGVGEYKFNGETYSAADIESARIQGNVNKISPYLGVGYKSGDRNQDGFSFDANLGVLFHGTPTVNLDVSCSDKLKSAPGDICTQLKDNVQKEQNKINDDIKGFKVHPVVSVGFMYRF